MKPIYESRNLNKSSFIRYKMATTIEELSFFFSNTNPNQDRVYRDMAFIYSYSIKNRFINKNIYKRFLKRT